MRIDRDGFIHILYTIILVQFVAIAILLAGFSNEYMANTYFQTWINSNYPWIGSLLQGQVDALLVGMALGATLLLIQRVRAEAELQHRDRPLGGGVSSLDSMNENSVGSASAVNFGSQEEISTEILAELEKGDS